MSVETNADRARTKIIIDINDAIKNLAGIVIDRTEGSEEFSHAYIACMRDKMLKLLDIRDELMGDVYEETDK